MRWNWDDRLLASVKDNPEASKALKESRELVHKEEERRLAHVAITRHALRGGWVSLCMLYVLPVFDARQPNIYPIFNVLRRAGPFSSLPACYTWPAHCPYDSVLPQASSFPLLRVCCAGPEQFGFFTSYIDARVQSNAGFSPLACSHWSYSTVAETSAGAYTLLSNFKIN
jgi:hypothetical protein